MTVYRIALGGCNSTEKKNKSLRVAVLSKHGKEILRD